MAKPLRILMIAPQPFFSPRGTPFSVYHRLLALSKLGHQVDLVTYPIGEDVSFPGLRIFRFRFPFFKKVKIGPSAKKIVLDFFLFFKVLDRLLRQRYDLIHSHEEMALAGVFWARLFRLPHLYDMHSSLPQQLSNFHFSRSRSLIRIGEGLEKTMVLSSRAVIVICPALEETVRRLIGDRPRPPRIFLIENVAGGDKELAPAEKDRIRARVTAEWRPVLAEKKIVLYAGTLEKYQGLDLLLKAGRIFLKADPSRRFLLVGGAPEQVDDYRRQAQGLGLGDQIIFAGQRPAEEIPVFTEMADVLVSPRSEGTNTPLKIYSYLASGRPIVATDLPTHTQVLDPKVAWLAAPSAEALAGALRQALAEPAEAGRRAAAARQLHAEKYSYDRYLDKTRELMEFMAEAKRS